MGLDSPYQGAVEILHNEQWGAVIQSSKTFEMNAVVVCRQLGLPGLAQLLSLTINNADHSWFSDVKCNGSEDSLASCPDVTWEWEPTNDERSGFPLQCMCHRGKTRIHCGSSLELRI